jgi:hypothetical protein
VSTSETPGAGVAQTQMIDPLRAIAGARSHRALLAVGFAAALICASAGDAFSSGCRPSRPKPTIILKTMGPCSFDPETLSYQGEPLDQAKCLMRSMDQSRNLGPPLDNLPPALADRIGQDTGLPSRETLSTFLSGQNLEWNFAAHLWQPIARARDNDPDAPSARYFVIHDTSGPNYGHRSFPDDIDGASRINNLANFRCTDNWELAHIIVNRSGGMLLGHDFGTPWRATKFERAKDFNGALKGLFVHTELIQPRRAAPGFGRYNDAGTPTPAFTAAQYDRLALLYTIASVRAEHWLIPAFHAAIDAEIRNGHDDPRNFDIESFAASIDALVEKLKEPRGEAVADATIVPAPAPMADGEASGLPLAKEPAVKGPDAKEPAAQEAIAQGPDQAPAAQAPADNTPTADETGAFIPAAVAALEHPVAGQPDALVVPSTAPKNPPDDSRKPTGERKTTTDEHCTARVVKRHRQRVCGDGAAASGEREGQRRESQRENQEHDGHDVRAVDRGVSHEGDGARHHGGDVHPHHARRGSRHRRA